MALNFTAKTTEQQELYSLRDLCKELSISVATGKNWLKLGKIIPSDFQGQTPYFTPQYVSRLKSDIQTGVNGALKSRRNKKYISGNNIYSSYISSDSPNLDAIQTLLHKIELQHVEITPALIVALLADCALQFIISKTEERSVKHAVSKFEKGHFKRNPYMFLIEDFIYENPFVASFVDLYPDLFDVQYTYEAGEDVLGLLYISLQNLGSRKATGSYYTPTQIVQTLIHRLLSMNDSQNKTVIDPCCGTGNFILQLPEAFDYTKVYGNDIDTLSVRIARINYALKYMVHDKDVIYEHITEKDYFSFSSDLKYDFIIGNPPWGYAFSNDEKKLLKQNFSCICGSNAESYDIFIEQALRNLNPKGVLSFVLPEAILNVKAHTPIRQLLSQNYSFQYIGYLGNAFAKVQCPCIILQTVYTNLPLSTRGLVIEDNNREFTIKKDRDVDFNCFSFQMTDDEYQILHKINHLETKTTLYGQAVFALGIVTGDNQKYISAEKKDHNEMVLKGSDLCKFTFKPSGNYLTFKPEAFQQAAPTEYYRAPEKLLYRFICNQLVFAYDNQQTLSLNSCNILIPQIPGLHIKYILAVLNSRTAQFYFQKMFDSVKVLRSHIEQIPIPNINHEKQLPIIQLTDAVIAAGDNQLKEELYNTLDLLVSDLFGLSEREYESIRLSLGEEKQSLFH